MLEGEEGGKRKRTGSNKVEDRATRVSTCMSRHAAEDGNEGKDEERTNVIGVGGVTRAQGKRGGAARR